MDIIEFRNQNDYLKVKKLMENKEDYIAIKFDEYSVNNLNVQGMMNMIQDYLIKYGYTVKEYGEANGEKEVQGYLYERVK